MDALALGRDASVDVRRTIAEVAVVFPVLVLVVLGLLQVSGAYGRQGELNAAARDGARLAAHPTATRADVETTVRAALQDAIGGGELDNATITVTPSSPRPCDGAAPGTAVLVTVSVPQQLALPLLTARGLTLTGTAEVPCVTAGGG